MKKEISEEAQIRKELMYDLANVWNKWFDYWHHKEVGGVQFPRYENEKAKLGNPDDNNEVMKHINAIQRILATQELKEQYPEFFK